MSADHQPASNADRRPRRRGRPALALFLLVVLLAVPLLFALTSPGEAEPYVLGGLVALAAIGVFTVFALAVGLVGRDERRDGVAEAVAAADPDAILVTDASGAVRYANPAYRALTGGGARVRDLPTFDRLLAGRDEAAQPLARLIEAARAARPAEEEVRLANGFGSASGGARWYRLSVAPIAVADVPRPLVLWRLVDVTEARHDQEAAFFDLQNVINFLDRAPAGFFAADAGGRIVFLNATLADWLGYDLATFDTGQATLAILLGEGGAVTLAALTGRPGETRTERFDIGLQRQGGGSLGVRLMHRVTFGSDGRPAEARTLVLERGAEPVATAPLSALSDASVVHFFDNAPFAIASVDGAGRVGLSNAPFRRLFGGIVGTETRLIDALAERDRAGLAAALAAAVGGIAEIAPVDATLIGDGQRNVRFYVAPAGEAGAGLAGAAIVYALDTTDQRALEVQFAQSQKMQAIGQLAGGVAHDFNNVLTAIIGFSDLLLASHRPTDPFFQDIMNIKQNANRAAGLVRQLLAFATRQTLRPERIVLTDVLADLTILLGRLIGEMVELRVVHGRDLWPVMADVNQLEQVVMNLAVNARDAMPEGGRLTIRTFNVPAADLRTLPEMRAFAGRALPPADHVMIEIADTGTGMPAETMEKIFEPFFTTKEVGKGTGLGLSTVYGIVTQSGGHIAVESEIGKGTVFRILLPRAASAERADAVRGETARSETLRAEMARTEISRLETSRTEAPRADASRGLPQRPPAALQSDLEEAFSGAVRADAAADADTDGAPGARVRAEPEGAHRDPVPAPGAAASDLTGNATILLVEDEEAVRAFAARALASRGYTVHQASTGTEALKVMREAGGRIDLVVSDVVMPEMDGPSLLRELRKTRPDLRIIFVSGYAEEAFARNLPANERFGFLPKPFTLKQLATAVKTALVG
ncbi:hybrid sensor histidine kinase/response regulator [Segnochrobactrum spirostomi]|uniref:hybrid sensor histidine kinase/response regulator n=1 Tax=Segnochrobactrum spirostomi TaxID=2608987 RepID=UPI001AD8258E|nr:PAS domain-containing sensor histidine kinase [Segnochrobactrum spirostomi]